MIARVLEIVAKHSAEHQPNPLPDAWVLSPASICMGDVRELAAEVKRLQAVLADRRRAELIEVASRLCGDAGVVDAVARAAVLIDNCDDELSNPGVSQRRTEEIRDRRLREARERHNGRGA